MITQTESSARRDGSSDNVLPFHPDRMLRNRRDPRESGGGEREVVAVVTVTRFIGDERVHAQVPVFADEVHHEQATRAELKNLIPDLSELVADAAVEANAYLDRMAAARNARPIAEFYARR